jgi:hypothetical protein
VVKCQHYQRYATRETRKKGTERNGKVERYGSRAWLSTIRFAWEHAIFEMNQVGAIGMSHLAAKPHATQHHCGTWHHADHPQRRSICTIAQHQAHHVRSCGKNLPKLRMHQVFEYCLLSWKHKITQHTHHQVTYHNDIISPSNDSWSLRAPIHFCLFLVVPHKNVWATLKMLYKFKCC